MTTPAPGPAEKTLQRVLTVSRFNGWSVVVIAVFGLLLTLVLGDLLGTLIGGLAVVAGWMEVRGHRKLRQRDPAGMKWLVRSQLFLLGVVLAYCASRLGSFDADTAMANLTPEMAASLKELGLERADILSMVAWAFSLAAAGLFPALTLGVWWKRANKQGCIAGMIIGFGICAYYLVGTRYFAVTFHEMWSWLGSATPAQIAEFAKRKLAWKARSL